MFWGSEGSRLICPRLSPMREQFCLHVVTRKGLQNNEFLQQVNRQWMFSPHVCLKCPRLSPIIGQFCLHVVTCKGLKKLWFLTAGFETLKVLALSDGYVAMQILKLTRHSVVHGYPPMIGKFCQHLLTWKGLINDEFLQQVLRHWKFSPHLHDRSEAVPHWRAILLSCSVMKRVKKLWFLTAGFEALKVLALSGWYFRG